MVELMAYSNDDDLLLTAQLLIAFGKKFEQ